LEINYNLLRAGEIKSSFNPVQKFGRMEGRNFRLHDTNSEYRLVWMDKPKKEKDIQ
jgi:hypothetical protein